MALHEDFLMSMCMSVVIDVNHDWQVEIEVICEQRIVI